MSFSEYTNVGQLIQRETVSKDEVETLFWWNVFYHCPFCGKELIGHHEYFYEKGSFKCDLSCAVCKKPIIEDKRFFWDLSGGWLFYNVETAECRKSAPPKNESEKWKSVRAILQKDMTYNSKTRQRFISTSPTFKEDIDKIFQALTFVRTKTADRAIENRFDKLINECDDLPSPAPAKKQKVLADNVELLKEYLSHLVSIETSIYSIKQHLPKLYRSLSNNALNIDLKKYELLSAKRANLADARRELDTCRARITRKTVTLNRSAYIPVRPSEPAAPNLQKPGLFNRKKVEEENNRLVKQYEDAMAAYNTKKAEYKAAEERYNIELRRLNSVADEEYKQAIATAEENARQEISEAEADLAYTEENVDKITIPEVAEKVLLEQEISTAEDTLKELILGRNELYSYNIVFGKYRNLVALSSFYEYLMSGRCSSLEGPNGAYNIFETEIRANQIISQLSDVINSLEQIKSNQYIAYSQLSEMNTSLAKLDRSMDNAVASLSSIEQSGQTIENYLERVAKNSDVIAYNSAKTAFYAKKTKELTDALGFLVALQ